VQSLVRVEKIGNATLYLGDCLEVLQTLGAVKTVITDPPYPDWMADEYQYKEGALELLGITRGFVFWSAKYEFPLPYSAIHIWDKKTGAGSEYERIFEIGGHKNFKVFRHYLINSTVAASFVGDQFTGHPSQKPIRLMRELVMRTDGAVFDPFMGSGSTGVACINLNRPFIGVEIKDDYFDIACERIENAQRQERLFA
jgi:site-specific DNA-methyltransferase (adenine-specific)